MRPSPAISISKPSPDDIPTLCHIVSAAFAYDTTTIALFAEGKAAELAPQYSRGMVAHFLEGKPDEHIYKATSEEDGTIVGYIALQYYAADWLAVQDAEDNDEDDEAEEREWEARGVNIKFSQDLMAGIGAMRARSIQGAKHVVLRSLFILPSYQRLGIGTRLMRYVFEKHALDKELVYLGSHVRGHDLYKRYGWEDVDHFDIDISKYMGKLKGYGIHRNFAMVRQPGPWKAT